MDPFHVVRLAGDALDQCRRRVQQATCGHRGRKGDPLYAARRTLHTGSDLLTDKQRLPQSESDSAARLAHDHAFTGPAALVLRASADCRKRPAGLSRPGCTV
jgi:transposase